MKAGHLFLCLTLAATVTAARPCRADTHSAEARDSYRRGKVAYDSGDFATAARAFAAADAVALNAHVLELAMTSAGRANDPIFGMTLVERADARGLTAAATAGRRLFTSRIGQVMVVCPEASHCNATMDEAVLSATRATWVMIGEHAVQLEIDGVVAQIVVKVESGKIAEIKAAERASAESPAPPPPVVTSSPATDLPGKPERARLNAMWFWGGVSATGVLGIASAISGADTMSMHAGLGSNPRDAGLADRGRSAETRTNVLLAATGVVALVTVVISYFVFRPREVSHGIANAR